jgi:signal peptidase II
VIKNHTILKKTTLAFAIILIVLIIDQTLKFWVKTNMTYGEEFSVLGLSWFKIHFVENNGMAFGLSLGDFYGKIALSVFRIVAVSFLIYLLHAFIKQGATFRLVFAFSLILAGAIGNILDSVFYGLLFSASTFHGPPAEFLPEGGGYAGLLFGKVVDMFYFPVYEGQLPEWFPFWKGQTVEFFRPVFNIADASITSGVLSIFLFNREIFSPGGGLIPPESTEERIPEEYTNTESAEEDLQNDGTIGREEKS